MFLSTILLKHPPPINRVLHINLDTSYVRMKHLCITAPKYGGLNRTFYDIHNTQFFVEHSRQTGAKMKNYQQVAELTFGSIKTCQTF